MNKTVFEEKIIDAEQTLYRVAKSILFYESDCEDAVQDAILKAYLKLHTLKQEQFFKTWIVRILINECYQKKSHRKETVSFEEYFENTLAEENKDYTELYTAVMQLDDKFRLPIILHYIEGYSVEDIKKIMKIPSGTVKSRLHKARLELKTTLKESENYYV